jgi:polyisoprenoid-binding protein YceI
MKSTFAFPLLTLSLVLAACSTTVIDDSQRLVPDGQDPFTGETLEVDPSRSFVAFQGKSNLINHEGKFNTFMIDITPDETTPQDFTRARVDAVIDVTSVETDAEGLTAHLQREDFFDAENFPLVTFRSTSLMATGGNTYQIGGDLMIKGTTLQATFDAVLTADMLVARYDLPRRVFGIGSDSYGDKLLEPLVPVEIQLVFRK